MKKFDLTRLLFLLTSVLILIGAFIIPKGELMIYVISALSIFCLIIFDIKASQITKLSDGNPKVKTVRNVNRLTIFIILVGCIFSVLSPIKNSLDTKNNEIILVGLFSIFIMFFGNLAPKIPFNRYMGLRLPWTIRDEDTWKLAHKILGYVSFPIAIVMFISVFFFKTETVATTACLTWIIIPSISSLVFYYKKSKGINI